MLTRELSKRHLLRGDRQERQDGGAPMIDRGLTTEGTAVCEIGVKETK